MGDTWQWQLQGTLNTSYDVAIYDVDLLRTSAATIDALHRDGRRVVCYVSVGSWERFRRDISRPPSTVLGRPLVGFPDERWLDIRRPQVRQMVATRFGVAAEHKCDGVEPDNVDAYENRTGFPLTAHDQLEFNEFVATQAHRRGFAVALKNDLGQIADLVGAFDFSVDEQCHEFDECAALRPFIDQAKPVFEAEYARSDGEEIAAVCAASRKLGIHTLFLPVELDDARRTSCDGPS